MKDENIAGFWRRIVAFGVDIVILGLAGLLLGLVFRSQFIALGAWGLIVGFAIELAYFGGMNSHLGGGQTLGKKLTNIKTVDRDNRPISLPRSLARFCILSAPYFLGGLHVASGTASPILTFVMLSAVYAISVATVYLYVFNRQTRQSLHDLIVGTLVLDAHAEKTELGAIWKPHILVTAGLFLCAGIAVFFGVSKNERLAELQTAQEAIKNHPSVRNAYVGYSQVTLLTSTDGTERTSTSYAYADVDAPNISLENEQFAREIAIRLTEVYPASLQKDVIQVKVRRGYSIGIWSSWRYRRYNFDPRELAAEIRDDDPAPSGDARESTRTVRSGD